MAVTFIFHELKMETSGIIIGDSMVKYMTPERIGIPNSLTMSWPGTRSSQLLHLLQRLVFKWYLLDWIIIHVGTNDLGADNFSPSGLASEIKSIVSWIRGNTSSRGNLLHIFVSLILPRRDDAELDRRRKRANCRIKATLKNDAYIINTEVPFEKSNSRRKCHLFAVDGLHITYHRGYATLMKTFLKALKSKNLIPDRALVETKEGSTKERCNKCKAKGHAEGACNKLLY